MIDIATYINKYKRKHIQTWFANFDEETDTLLYKNIYFSHFILERVDVSVVCERCLERHILRKRTSSSHICFQEPGGCQRLHPLASSSEMPMVGWVSLVRLRFSALCLNLTAWFSSRDPLPVTYLFDLGALIVMSCLLIKMCQLAKHTGSLGTNQKSMAYVTNRRRRKILENKPKARWPN